MAGPDLLASLYKVAFDHDAFDEPADIFIDPAAVQDLFYNADLLLYFLPELEWLASMRTAGFSRFLSSYFSRRSWISS